MFKRSILAGALAAALALIPHAKAADVTAPAVKAAPIAGLVYPTGSGWFWGVSMAGMGGSAVATNSTAQGGNVIGGRFGIDGGYTGTIGNTFWFAEVSVSGQAISGASPVLNVVSSVNFEERLAIGVPQNVYSQVLALVPGLNSTAFPSVPTLSGVSFGAPAPYVFGALYQDDVSATLGASAGKSWLLSYGAGVGYLSRASNGMLLDMSVEWKHEAAGMLVGGSNVTPFQDAYLATMRLKF